MAGLLQLQLPPHQRDDEGRKYHLLLHVGFQLTTRLRQHHLRGGYEGGQGHHIATLPGRRITPRKSHS